MSIATNIPLASKPTSGEAAIELRGLTGTVSVAEMPKRSAAPPDCFGVALAAGAEYLAVVIARNQAWELARWLDGVLGRRVVEGQAKEEAKGQAKEEAGYVATEPMIVRTLQRQADMLGKIKSAESIVAFACELFDVPPTKLRAAPVLKAKPLPMVRAVVGAFLRERGMSTPQVGEVLGVHHSTVVLGCQNLTRGGYHRTMRVHDNGWVGIESISEIRDRFRVRFPAEEKP